MAFSLKSRRLRLGLAVLVTVAMSLVGFAHALPRGDQLDLADYALPDGTLPTFCLAMAEQASQQSETGVAVCDTCLLGAGFQLPLAKAPPIGRAQEGLLIGQALPDQPPRSLCRSGHSLARAPPTLIS